MDRHGTHRVRDYSHDVHKVYGQKVNNKHDRFCQYSRYKQVCLGYEDEIRDAILSAIEGAIKALGQAKGRDKWKWNIYDAGGK
eukprot:11092538-Karenia_brevis.AAC.1